MRVATGDESDKPNTMLVDVDAGRSGKRTYMFEAESVKECDLWLSALRKVAKADTPEHVERRTESTAVRRSAAFGPAIRTLYGSLQPCGRGCTPASVNLVCAVWHRAARARVRAACTGSSRVARSAERCTAFACRAVVPRTRNLQT